jgi:hypothetical protein
VLTKDTRTFGRALSSENLTEHAVLIESLPRTTVLCEVRTADTVFTAHMYTTIQTTSKSALVVALVAMVVVVVQWKW